MDSWLNATHTERRLYCLISLIFSNHPKLLEFFFERHSPRSSLKPDEMLKAARCFSSGEQVLIRVALDLWSESGGAQVRQLLHVLDQDSCSNVLKALDNWRHFMRAN
jgi:hypothetical protein